jgi:hypothetical protein
MPQPHSINNVVDSLFYALQSLGCSVDIQENEPIHDGTNIFFRAHLLQTARISQIPPGSIIYNFEQISDQSPWLGPVYRSLLSRFTVWDYSRRNLTTIGSIADRRHLHLVPIGYVPELTQIPPSPTEDIDVLFYGAVNQRRYAILLALQHAGLRVRAETSIRDHARDALISRAKVVLNLHFYPSAIFEIVRVSYLLANRKAVVGECGLHTEIDSDIREAIAPANYYRLCDTVLELLRDDSRRLDLAQRGHEIFAKRRLPDIIAQAITETEAASGESVATSTEVSAGAAVFSLSKTEPADKLRKKSAVGGLANIVLGPKRVLFHAINGSGLGHVVRLSVIAQTLQTRADIAFFSTCAFANRYWTGKIFTVDDRLDDRFELNPEQRDLLGFHLALNKFSPDVVVFDTHWPQSVMGQLREKGIRTVLVLRSQTKEKMEPALRLAIRDFASVLIPHYPVELESTYGAASELVGLMTTAPCVCIGPVARTTAPRHDKRSLIFTLGGGGEYWNATQALSVDRFIEEYRCVAMVLAEKFSIESIFAAGPLLNRADDKLSPFKVVRSHNLHEMFGPRTIVVTRGGYNTCWEAVAAGAGLIVVSEGIDQGVEDVATRGHFLAAERLAKHVRIDASEILNACTDFIERGASVGDNCLRLSINAGLPIARDEILGLSGLVPSQPKIAKC